MNHLGPSLRRAKVRERPGRRLAAALAASILLNSLLFLVLAKAGAFQLAPPKPARVSLAPVAASQWAANRAIRPGAGAPTRPAEPLALPKAPALPVPEKHAAGEVVDVAPSQDSTPPKSSRFLSDRDSSVEKETRSKHARAGYERTLPTPQLPGVQSAPASGEGGKSAKAVPGAEGPKAVPEAPKGEPRVALAPEAGGDLASGRAAGEEGARPPPTPGAGEGGQRKEGVPSDLLHVPPGTLARLAGGPAPDRLEAIEEGEGTFLNTRGWKYATYFNRMKQALAAAWDPATPFNTRDPDRSIFGFDDRTTLLGVTLDDTGHLKTLAVQQTSGVSFLDHAAVAAFREAQPFVNPPRGLADPNGEIKFLFSFTFSTDRPGFRVYRSQPPTR